MAMKIDYPSGATPLDADELSCLIPDHITTKDELNEWEQHNIEQGEAWAQNQHKEILDEGFVRQLHHRMLGETWSWAGGFRTSDKKIGVEWQQIGVKLSELINDVRYQIENNTYPPDEIATRFHHRLVTIHLFPNGNSRHARMMADLLIQKLGHQRFTWGSKSLTDFAETRTRYIEALQAADGGDIAPLMGFVRS